MSRLSKRYEYMSLDDFEELLLDKPADEKWELIGGRVIRGMVGARWEHNRIVANILSTLMNGLRGKGSDCRPFAETFWLKQRFLDLAVFPDVMVRCGPLPPDAISLDDPVVLFEVLSKGSVQRDRLEKWALYQRHCFAPALCAGGAGPDRRRSFRPNGGRLPPTSARLLRPMTF